MEQKTKRNLNVLLHKYILPSSSAALIAGRNNSRSGINFLNQTGSSIFQHSYSHLPHLSITHTNKMYSSPMVSSEVLQKNKVLYSSMIGMLKNIEDDQLNKTKLAVKGNKTKLNIFRNKVSYRARKKLKEDEKIFNSLPSIEENKDKKNYPNFQRDRVVHKSAPMPIKWTLCSTKGYRVEAREGGTFTTVKIKVGGKIEERIYLIGGLSRGLIQQVAYFTIDQIKKILVC